MIKPSHYHCAILTIFIFLYEEVLAFPLGKLSRGEKNDAPVVRQGRFFSTWQGINVAVIENYGTRCYKKIPTFLYFYLSTNLKIN
jgi:hypothetical protein